VQIIFEILNSIETGAVINTGRVTEKKHATRKKAV